MELYERDSYLNRDMEYLCNNEIYEYDISRAGLNLSIYYNLLPKDIIDKALSMEKDKQTRYLGIVQREDKEYTMKLKEAFKDIRKLFFIENGLDKDSILSIKKDAIFTLTPCKSTVFDNVEFKMKNYYTSYYYFDKYEFYHNENKLDIKNIGQYAIKRHKDYMIDYLFKLFNIMEKTSKRNKVIKALVEFRNYYVTGDLDQEYYREFNSNAKFLVKFPDSDELTYTNEAVCKEYIIKNYNFDTYIKPLSQILY